MWSFDLDDLQRILFVGTAVIVRLGKIAVVAQHLEAFGVPVELEPLLYCALEGLTMLTAIIVDMVNGKKLNGSFPATGTMRWISTIVKHGSGSNFMTAPLSELASHFGTSREVLLSPVEVLVSVRTVFSCWPS